MPGLGPPDGVAMLDETAHCLYRAWSFLARGTGHFWASHYSFGIYGLLKEFRKLHSMSQGRLPVWRNHWKRFILAHKLSGVGIQGIIWKWRKMWARLMESSKKKNLLLLLAGCRKALNEQRDSDAHQHFCPWRDCPDPFPSRLCLEASQFNFYPYAPGYLQVAALHWSPEWMNLLQSKSVHCTGHSKGTSGTPKALLFNMQFQLAFTARCYGNSSALLPRQEVGLGLLATRWGPLLLRYPS